MINIDPLCWTQVPLLLIWLLDILRGCGNPEWYQVPSQDVGNWQSLCFCKQQYIWLGKNSNFLLNSAKSSKSKNVAFWKIFIWFWKHKIKEIRHMFSFESINRLNEPNALLPVELSIQCERPSKRPQKATTCCPPSCWGTSSNCHCFIAKGSLFFSLENWYLESSHSAP